MPTRADSPAACGLPAPTSTVMPAGMWLSAPARAVHPRSACSRWRAPDSSLIASWMAYEDVFPGGVRVATGVYPGGFVAPFQVVTTPGPGRPVALRAWSVAGGGAVEVAAGQMFADNYLGGALVAAGDVDGDGGLISPSRRRRQPEPAAHLLADPTAVRARRAGRHRRPDWRAAPGHRQSHRRTRPARARPGPGRRRAARGPSLPAPPAGGFSASSCRRSRCPRRFAIA